jgi:hypothetical protein
VTERLPDLWASTDVFLWPINKMSIYNLFGQANPPWKTLTESDEEIGLGVGNGARLEVFFHEIPHQCLCLYWLLLWRAYKENLNKNAIGNFILLTMFGVPQGEPGDVGEGSLWTI